MEIISKLKTGEAAKLSKDDDNNFSDSILGEEVNSNEEPVDNAAAQPDPEPDGGVPTPDDQQEEPSGDEGQQPSDDGDQGDGQQQPPPQGKKPEEPKGFTIDEAKYKADMDELEKYRALAPHWQRFVDDPLSFVKELGIPVKDSQENYDSEYQAGVAKVRAKYGDDFEIDPSSLANPMSDSAKYLKEINDLQFSLQMKHKDANSKFSDPIKHKEQLWVSGEKELKQVIADTMKEYNTKEEELVPAFRQIAEITKSTDIDELKISFAKAFIPMYIKAEKGLRSQSTVKKIEEKIAAEAKGKVTSTPTGQKSQIRPQTNIISPFSDEREMFKKVF